VFGFTCLSAWWVCRAAPLGRTPPLRIAGSLLAAATLASVLTAVFASTLAQVLASVASHIGRESIGAPSAALMALGMPAYLFSAAIHYLIVAFEDSRHAERRALEALVMARESELRALRAQLNPHFLFNSLNSINSLVGTDPEAARRMCERLGEFLRQTLALGARDAVTLGEELDLVEKYLAIERVRFGERLAARVDAPANARRCRVPPLLLQPLVENAVKHGIADRVEGGVVEIMARRIDSRLTIEVANPVDADAPERQGEGVGLENVRRRLRAIDPRGASLIATRAAQRFQVVLSLAASTGDEALPASTGQGALS
jgi:LytS/YehU family sensor histidine kinase